MNFKRIKSIGCFFVLLLFLIPATFGCENQTAVKADPPVTLIWWQIGPQPADFNKVSAKINEYLEEKINVHLDLRYCDINGYTSKLSRIIQSGEYYDMAFTSSWANPFITNSNAGAYRDLKDLLPEYGRSLTGTIPDQLWRTVTIDSHIYGVPVYKDSVFAPYFVFNKNELDKLGLKAQDFNTLEKLEPALAAYKKAHSKSYPLEFLADEGYHGFFDEFDMLLGNDLPIGVQLTDGKATVVNPFETDIIQKKWDTLHHYYQMGYINPNCTTLQKRPDIVFCYGAHGYPYADVTCWSDHYPAVGVPRYDSYFTTGSVTSAINAVSVLSRHPEKCIQVLDLIDSDVYLRNLLAYGIEGENYEQTSKTSVRMLNYRWNPMTFSQGTYFNLYTVDPAPRNLWTALKRQNDSSKFSPILGFSFDSRPIESQVAMVKSEFASYKPDVLSGARSRKEVYNQMIASLKAKGLDDIITEAQKQVDQWKAGTAKETK